MLYPMRYGRTLTTPASRTSHTDLNRKIPTQTVHIGSQVVMALVMVLILPYVAGVMISRELARCPLADA